MSEPADVVLRPSEAVTSPIGFAFSPPDAVEEPSDEVPNRPEQSDARPVDQTEPSQEAGANPGDPPTQADKWQQSLSQLGQAASDFSRENNISRRYAIETMLKCCGWTKYSVEDVEVAIQLSRGQSHQPSPEVIEISDDSDSAKEATPAERTTTTKKRRGKAEPWSIEQHIVTVRCILHAGRQGGTHWRNIAAHVNQVGGNKRSISVMQKTFWETELKLFEAAAAASPPHLLTLREVQTRCVARSESIGRGLTWSRKEKTALWMGICRYGSKLVDWRGVAAEVAKAGPIRRSPQNILKTWNATLKPKYGL